MSSYRAQGFLAIGLGAIAFAACVDRPELDTDLRPEGDPELLAVLVQTDVPYDGPLGPIAGEVATWCKDNDLKVPSYIGLPNLSVAQICPDPEDNEDPFEVTTVTNADPMLWQVRFVFDELLDPDVETLADGVTGGACTDASEFCVGHIDTTQPVNLQCGGADVPYDGYYAPNGNNVSWPPGPSLVVQPATFVATSSECTISLKDGAVTDKDGNPVPADGLIDVDFQIAPLALLGTDPEDGATVAADTTPAVFFNAPIDLTTIAADEITLETAAGAPVAFTLATDATGTVVVAVPDAELAAGDYVLTVAGTAVVADIAGGELTVGEDVVVTFTVE